MTPATQLLGGAVLELMLARAPVATDAEAVRYGEIAHAVAVAAQDGARSVEHAASRAALLVAIAWHEGRFDPAAVGDHGRSCTTWQVQVGRTRCAVLAGDIVAGAELALERAEKSLGACHREDRSAWLSAYASGRCSAGRRESARMVRSWDRWRPRLVAAVQP